MKENYPIYVSCKFYWTLQSAGWDFKLSHKKIKTLFLSNMSKSRRLTQTFFPDNAPFLWNLTAKRNLARFLPKLMPFFKRKEWSHYNQDADSKQTFFSPSYIWILESTVKTIRTFCYPQCFFCRGSVFGPLPKHRRWREKDCSFSLPPKKTC